MPAAVVVVMAGAMVVGSDGEANGFYNTSCTRRAPNTGVADSFVRLRGYLHGFF